MDPRGLSYLWLVLLGLALLTQGLNPVSDDEDDEEEEDEEFDSSLIPHFKSVSMNFNVTAGRDITLPCSVEDLGGYVLLWSKDTQVLYTGQTILLNNDRLKLQDDHSLTILNVGMTDNGTYTCELSTNPPIKLEHHVRVVVPPIVNVSPDREILGVREGSPFSLKCEALGEPTPNITWRFKGVWREGVGKEIHVEKAAPGDAGEYQCVADNGVGAPAVRSITVTVIGDLQIHLKNRWIHDENGMVTAEMTCNVDYVPPPRVTWFKGVEPLRSSDRITITKSGTKSVLTISYVTDVDFGVYVCQASSQFDNFTQQISISGLASPVILDYHEANDKEVHSLDWTVESYSPIETFKVTYRMIGNDGNAGSWTTKTVEGSKRSFELKDVEVNAKYEAVVFALNKFGWNNGNEPLFFKVMRAAPNSGAPRLPLGALIVPFLVFYFFY